MPTKNSSLKISPARFSKKTLDFLKTAGETTSLTWLEAHKEEHQAYVVEPLKFLAHTLFSRLAKLPEARGYKLPKQGFGRLRRPKHKIGRGDVAYRNWVSLQSARPSKSIFDENPGVYFFLSPNSIFTGGGLYMASSRQVKQIRAYIDNDASNFDSLFKSKPFKREFPDGFATDKILKTFPRLYSPDHKRIEWLKLQAFYVKREFTKKELYSAEFPDLVFESWKQSLRLNEVLFEALSDWNQTFAPAPEEAIDKEPDDDVTTSSADLWDDRL